jgi:hypothetical protein
VLLKNSILRSQPLVATTSAANKTDVPPPNTIPGEGEYDDDEEEEETDSFLFPDAGKLLDSSEKTVSTPEAQWLDSLLETLVDEDEYEMTVDAQVSALPADEDEDLPLSPLISPMSSSDDLVDQSVYFPPPIAVPYPIPYPPVHHAYADPASSLDSPLDTHLPPLYDDCLPFLYDLDDVEALSVPEAIEDTSDDESDAPLTPSCNSTSTLSLDDPASIPLPPERRRRSHPRVYDGTDNPYFYSFELDPLPFAEDLPTYTAVYQEC